MLRPIRLSDVEDVLAYESSEGYGRYLLTHPDPYTRRHAEERVARAVLNPWGDGALFAIELDGRVVGDLTLDFDPHLRRAEIGYGIGREHWGLGIAVEAATAVIDWALKTLDIAEVYARADADNQQSIRVMEKLGMKRESYEPVLWRDGGRVCYSLPRSDWG